MRIRVAYPNELWHYGVKGMKWGVRRGPPYPLLNSVKYPRTIIKGHRDAPRDGIPNTITDHVYSDGKVHTRTHYGADGRKDWEIHTDDHGNSKGHPYGKHGEHRHDYQWYDDGRSKRRDVRGLTENERRENADIL